MGERGREREREKEGERTREREKERTRERGDERRPKKVFILIGGFARKSSPREETDERSERRTRDGQ